VYSQADYEGVVDDAYRRYGHFSRRAQDFQGRWNQLLTAKNLIAGCGWGYLLDEMTTRGFTDLWGFDASAYAIQQAQIVLPVALRSRVFVADVLSTSDMQDMRQNAGLRGQQRFTGVLTEDLLPCAASVAEAQTMLANLRAISQSMAHIITPRDSEGVLQPDGSVIYPWGGQLQMPGFLWLSAAEWRAIIGSGERIFLTGTYEEVP
jgi:hypothetical protein